MEIIIKRFFQLMNVFFSYLYKWSIDLKIRKIHSIASSYRNQQIIVTLTSYGRRTETNVVYYTIVSILNQTLKPDKIILWLDKDNWDENKIPRKLKSLIDYGLTIKFCEDIKSYKKLIPTLKEYPNDILITIDDDVIYPNDLIETFYLHHQKKPACVICGKGRFIIKDSKGEIEDYNNWKSAKCFDENVNIVPIGVGGILYPPNSLYKDILDKELFMKLTPNADDLWFWAMEYLNNTKQIVVEPKGLYLSFDALYQFLHKGTALTHLNAKEGHNNIQLKNIIDYYSIQI